MHISFRYKFNPAFTLTLHVCGVVGRFFCNRFLLCFILTHFEGVIPEALFIGHIACVVKVNCTFDGVLRG